MSVVWACKCGQCGTDLDYSCKLDSGEDLIVTVELCSGCKQNITDESYEEGRSDGYDSGYDDGKNDGYQEAKREYNNEH